MNQRKEWQLVATLVDNLSLWGLADITHTDLPMNVGFHIRHITTHESKMIHPDTFERMKKLDLLEIDPTKPYGVSESLQEFSIAFSDESFIDELLKPKRPSWDEYFMATAHLMATRSTCDRLFVGCVLVKDNHIVAEGYNGSVAGHPHCDEVGHLMYENGCKRTVHAEKNALNMCAKFGISAQGTTAYVTHYPCPDCMRELNQAGVTEIVYGSYYQHRYENNFHEGIKLREFTGRSLNFQWATN